MAYDDDGDDDRRTCGRADDGTDSVWTEWKRGERKNAANNDDAARRTQTAESNGESTHARVTDAPNEREPTIAAGAIIGKNYI